MCLFNGCVTKIMLIINNDCQALLLQYMMIERQHRSSKIGQTLSNQQLQQLAASHQQKRQGVGISHEARNYLSGIENSIFSQAAEISAILEDQSRIQLEGLTYQLIQQSGELSGQLQKVRMNAPVYQNMRSHEKKKYFQKLAVLYLSQLSAKTQQAAFDKSLLDNQETVEASQSSITKEKRFGKKIKKSSAVKVRLISEVDQYSDYSEMGIKTLEYKTPKKVSFFSGSQKKYFAKEEPVQKISEERIYQYFTLDKL